MNVGKRLFLVHLNHVQDVCKHRIDIRYVMHFLFLAACACFCNPCLTALLTDRVGDHLLTCCLNPCALMAVRTKVRATYKIKVKVYL